MSEGTRWTQSITGLSSTVGFPAIWFTDPLQNPFSIGGGVVMNSTATTPSYNIEAAFGYTGSSVYISSNDTWFPISGVASASSNATFNIAFPIAALRVNSISGSSTQTIVVTAIQAGA